VLVWVIGLLRGGYRRPDHGESLDHLSDQAGFPGWGRQSRGASRQRLLDDITGELLQTKSCRLRTGRPAKRINVQRARLTFLGDSRQNTQRGFHYVQILLHRVAPYGPGMGYVKSNLGEWPNLSACLLDTTGVFRNTSARVAIAVTMATLRGPSAIFCTTCNR
jgi:hypothetical protein